jgi:hypothetical protein
MSTSLWSRVGNKSSNWVLMLIADAQSLAKDLSGPTYISFADRDLILQSAAKAETRGCPSGMETFTVSQGMDNGRPKL